MKQNLMSICFKGGLKPLYLDLFNVIFFYFVPLQITIKPPFGRICFSFFKYLKQIHCYFVGFKLESYPPSPVQKCPATKKQWNSVVLVFFSDPKLQNHLLLRFFSHVRWGGGIPEMVANQIWGSSRRPDIFFAFVFAQKRCLPKTNGLPVKNVFLPQEERIVIIINPYFSGGPAFAASFCLEANTFSRLG